MSIEDALRMELGRAILRASHVYDPASRFLSEMGIPLPVLAWCVANPEAAKGLAEATLWAAPNQATREMVNEGNRYIDLYLVWSAMRKAAASTPVPSGEAQGET